MKFKYSPDIFSQAPTPELERVSGYPRIYSRIKDTWGTVGLKNFITDLLADTRDGTRQGFSKDVTAALVSLSVSNTAYLESLGLDFDLDPLDVSWKLPKNF